MIILTHIIFFKTVQNMNSHFVKKPFPLLSQFKGLEWLAGQIGNGTAVLPIPAERPVLLIWSDIYGFFQLDIPVRIFTAYDNSLLHNQGQALAKRSVSCGILCFLRVGGTGICHSASCLRFIQLFQRVNN